MTVRASILELAQFIRASESRLLVITGAGVSTPSNIPDYRGPNGAYVKNKAYKPIQYQEFMSGHYYRQRYWARSMLGYGNVQNAQPNVIHTVLANWQRRGRIHGIITQNVDSLHLKGGAQSVLELHGTLARVECQSCKATTPRAEFQKQLVGLNPTFARHLNRPVSDEERVKTVIPPSHTSPGEGSRMPVSKAAAPMRPDGDVDMDSLEFSTFNYPSCSTCSTGTLKPGVIFFGENIPGVVKDRATQLVNDARGVLVLGSTLTTYSAYRLIRDATSRGVPVWCVTQGPTRADALFTGKIEAQLEEVLPAVDAILEQLSTSSQ
ncbi:DHS-like NAD/FAD-binding domain-containing protein [Blastocladiella britannica]|nr:DHS-like NAD/FAD-binding domain-containing protein [Blastocladiella britannica]